MRLTSTRVCCEVELKALFAKGHLGIRQGFALLSTTAMGVGKAESIPMI